MSALTIVNWCPGDACDPCGCVWALNGGTLPRISNPGHPDDGAIDQDASFCGAPFWGIAFPTTSGADPGEIVNGYIDITVSTGDLSNSGPPPDPSGVPIIVVYQSVTVFSFNAMSGLPTDILINPHDFFGIYRLTIPGCIKLDPAKDYIPVIFYNPLSGGVNTNFNCVLPFAGPIPDPVFSISPSCTGQSGSIPDNYTEFRIIAPGPAHVPVFLLRVKDPS